MKQPPQGNLKIISRVELPPVGTDFEMDVVSIRPTGAADRRDRLALSYDLPGGDVKRARMAV